MRKFKVGDRVMFKSDSHPLWRYEPYVVYKVEDDSSGPPEETLIWLEGSSSGYYSKRFILVTSVLQKKYNGKIICDYLD